uniref:Minor tail protein Z n=1 Tax=Geobacter metallireducens TaxID=28232 RepID=A0A831UAY3_GEOME
MRFVLQGFEDALNAATEETIKDVRAAIKSTMTKVLRSVKSLTSEEIRKVYNVPKSVLDQRLELFTARINNLESVLVVGGKSVSLSYFNARQFRGASVITRAKVTTRKRAGKFQGVEVEVIKGERTRLKSAFMQRFASGHLGILTRTSTSRYPVLIKSAVSVASMFNRVDINDAIVRKIDEDLERVFRHELEFYLNRGAR